MITNNLSITIADTYKDAPNYGADTCAVKIDKCIVVKKGMTSGMPSIDLQMTDENGNKYVALMTGNILESMAQVARGAACE